MVCMYTCVCVCIQACVYIPPQFSQSRYSKHKNHGHGPETLYKEFNKHCSSLEIYASMKSKICRKDDRYSSKHSGPSLILTNAFFFGSNLLHIFQLKYIFLFKRGKKKKDDKHVFIFYYIFIFTIIMFIKYCIRKLCLEMNSVIASRIIELEEILIILFNTFNRT